MVAARHVVARPLKDLIQIKSQSLFGVKNSWFVESVESLSGRYSRIESFANIPSFQSVPWLESVIQALISKPSHPCPDRVQISISIDRGKLVRTRPVSKDRVVLRQIMPPTERARSIQRLKVFQLTFEVLNIQLCSFTSACERIRSWISFFFPIQMLL